MIYDNRIFKQTGATLLEVVIALFVITIGLTGITALQVAQLRQISQANLYYIANQQALDIIDRMRANPAGLSDYASGTTAPVDGACYNTACIPSTLAAVDLKEWNDANNLLLPGGAGTVTFNSTQNTYTIKNK